MASTLEREVGIYALTDPRDGLVRYAGGPIKPTAKKNKLTDEEVAEIRRQAEQGVKGIVLARQFGVDPSHISKILNNFVRRQARTNLP